MTYRDTVNCVSDLVSFRMDTQTRRALQRLQQMGMSQSDAIRHAIQESADALHQPKRLAAEMAALDAGAERVVRETVEGLPGASLSLNEGEKS